MHISKDCESTAHYGGERNEKGRRGIRGAPLFGALSIYGQIHGRWPRSTLGDWLAQQMVLVFLFVPVVVVGQQVIFVLFVFVIVICQQVPFALVVALVVFVVVGE
jgi:hypothetical protein